MSWRLSIGGGWKTVLVSSGEIGILKTFRRESLEKKFYFIDGWYFTDWFVGFN